jgi:DNA-binding MarR family transcriptional regulator
MAAESTPTYRFGDLVALARQSWLYQMTSRLERLGYAGYRRGDVAVMRMLLRGPLPVGRLGAVLGVTRQAARKVADGLEQRGYATTQRGSRDARQVNVTLTPAGRDYAGAVIALTEELNRGSPGGSARPSSPRRTPFCAPPCSMTAPGSEPASCLHLRGNLPANTAPLPYPIPCQTRIGHDLIIADTRRTASGWDIGAPEPANCGRNAVYGPRFADTIGHDGIFVNNAGAYLDVGSNEPAYNGNTGPGFGHDVLFVHNHEGYNDLTKNTIVHDCIQRGNHPYHGTENKAGQNPGHCNTTNS